MSKDFKTALSSPSFTSLFISRWAKDVLIEHINEPYPRCLTKCFVCVGICMCRCALNLERPPCHLFPLSNHRHQRSVASVLWVFVCSSRCHSSLRTSCQPAIGQGVAKVTEQGGPAVFGWQNTDSVSVILLPLCLRAGDWLFSNKAFRSQGCLKLCDFFNGAINVQYPSCASSCRPFNSLPPFIFSLHVLGLFFCWSYLFF